MKLKLLLLALGSILAVLILEFSLQQIGAKELNAFNNQWRPFYSWGFYSRTGIRISEKNGLIKLSHSPYVGYRNLPNQSSPYFTINERGYRGPPVSETIPKGGRVIILGGSTAFGTGLKGDEFTFARKLAKELPDTEVINAAVIGYISGQEFVAAATELIDLTPKLLIVINGWNDLHAASLPFTKNGDSAEWFLQVDTQLVKHFKEGLLNRTVESTLNLFPALTATIRERLAPAPVASDVNQDSASVPEEAAVRYIRNMVKLRDLLQTRSWKPLLLIQPDINAMRLSTGTLSDSPDDQFAQDYNTFRKLARAQLLQAGVATEDLNEFSALLRPELFLDSVHLNEEGNQVLSEIVSRVIRRDGAAAELS